MRTPTFINGFDPKTGLVEYADPMYFVINCVDCKETTPTADEKQAVREWSKLKQQHPGDSYRLVFTNPNNYPNDLTEKAIRRGDK